MITTETILSKAACGAVYTDYPSVVNHRIRVIARGNHFKLKDGRIVTIRTGFEWDEASVPWIISWAFPKSGIYSYSALVHDALYYAQATSRKEADREFLRYMEATGISWIQRQFRYLFVRSFGWLYWDKNTNNTSKRAI